MEIAIIAIIIIIVQDHLKQEEEEEEEEEWEEVAAITTTIAATTTVTLLPSTQRNPSLPLLSSPPGVPHSLPLSSKAKTGCSKAPQPTAPLTLSSLLAPTLHQPQPLR